MTPIVENETFSFEEKIWAMVGGTLTKKFVENVLSVDSKLAFHFGQKLASSCYRKSQNHRWAHIWPPPRVWGLMQFL